ncbi:MAG: 4-amino-4-deoxy-L-arabinose transferase [Aeromicrobium sp.]
MAPIRHDALAALIDRRAPACGATKVIAVDGPSGAGKTEFANALGAALGAPVLHLEDVYPGWSGLAATPELIARGVLAALAVGDVGEVARWDWEHERRGDLIKVAPGPLLILEGVGSGARVCRPYLSLLVWLDAPAFIRKTRALSRDGEVFAPFWDMWAEQERRLFEADGTRAAAEVVVDTGGDGILDPTRTDRGERNGRI